MTRERGGLVRALDANLNRAREGLRVGEDLVRFCGGSPARFRRLRRIRHGLSGVMARLPLSARELVAARDTEHDAGRRLTGAPTASAQHALLINLQRAKEALRVIEECLRALTPRLAPAIQRLRFDLYDAERDLLLSTGFMNPREPRRVRQATGSKARRRRRTRNPGTPRRSNAGAGGLPPRPRRSTASGTGQSASVRVVARRRRSTPAGGYAFLLAPRDPCSLARRGRGDS